MDINDRVMEDNSKKWEAEQAAKKEAGLGWHISKLCFNLGVSENETNIIKYEFGIAFQKFFGGNIAYNFPEQYSVQQNCRRQGDPTGLIGTGFKFVRKVYYLLEYIPLVNNLGLWAWFDCLVLSHSENPTVQRYVKALKQDYTLAFTN